MPSSSQGFTFSNVSATTAPFTLNGGKYGVDCGATFGGGSVKLQKLLGDLSTFQSVSSGTDFAAAGYAVIDLPPGQYRFTIATATGVFAGITGIPS